MDEEIAEHVKENIKKYYFNEIHKHIEFHKIKALEKTNKRFDYNAISITVPNKPMKDG